jgi:hypothetical protein
MRGNIKDVKRRIRELGAFATDNQSYLMQLCGAHPKAVGASYVLRNRGSRDFGLMFTYDKAPAATFLIMEITEQDYLDKNLPCYNRYFEGHACGRFSMYCTMQKARPNTTTHCLGRPKSVLTEVVRTRALVEEKEGI